jgi:uncharacterized protein YqjF (DUF2071 family)
MHGEFTGAMNRQHSPLAILDAIPPVATSVPSLQLDRLSPSVRPAGSPRGYQRWRSLLFLHWPVPPEQLRPLVPADLSLDLHGEMAYLGIVLFAMEGVRHRWWPERLSMQFLEANVRTYVYHEETPGIYFLSLDANSRLAVWGARAGWSLPYHHARMEMTTGQGETAFQIRRSRSDVLHHVRYRVGEMLEPSEPGTLEHFLLERYWLFVRHRNQLCKAQVHHCPYPARHAELLEFEDQLRASAGLYQLNGDPPLVHFVEGVDTEIFGLQPA